jgi:hypothetical protein
MRVLFLVIVFGGVCTHAVANDFSIKLEAHPLQASLLANLQMPGAAGPDFFGDVSSGAQARLQVLFLQLNLDYQHFYSHNFELLHAGLGYELALPTQKNVNFQDAKAFVRGQLGLLVLAKAGQSSLVGFRLGGCVGFTFPVNHLLTAGVQFDVSAMMAGSFAFCVGLSGNIGLKL